DFARVIPVRHVPYIVLRRSSASARSASASGDFFISHFLFEDISEPACGASMAAVSGASCNRARKVSKEEKGGGVNVLCLFLSFISYVQILSTSRSRRGADSLTSPKISYL